MINSTTVVSGIKRLVYITFISFWLNYIFIGTNRNSGDRGSFWDKIEINYIYKKLNILISWKSVLAEETCHIYEASVWLLLLLFFLKEVISK